MVYSCEVYVLYATVREVAYEHGISRLCSRMNVSEICSDTCCRENNRYICQTTDTIGDRHSLWIAQLKADIQCKQY